MEIRYIVTDVDGVILDRMHMFAKIFAQLASQKWGAQKVLASECYLSTAGTPLPDQLRGFAEICSQKPKNEEIKLLEKNFFAEVQKRRVPVFEGAVATITSLHRMGKRFFATTGSQTAEIVRIFKAIEIFDCYEKIMGSDKIPKSATHILGFAIHLRIPLEDFATHVIYVGDGPYDMEIAKSCGIVGVGIPSTVPEDRLREAGASHIIQSFAELPALIEKLEGEKLE